MNEESRQFAEDPAFDIIYQELYKTHRPIKPDWQADTLQAIGKVIVQFQRLERTVHSSIGVFINTFDNLELSSIITVNLSFRNSVIILLNAARQKSFYRYDDLKLVVEKALKAEEIRNQIVHSVWTSGPRIKTNINKDGLKVKVEHYEIGELARLVEQIDRIDTAIDALCSLYIEFILANGVDIPGVKVIQ